MNGEQSRPRGSARPATPNNQATPASSTPWQLEAAPLLLHSLACFSAFLEQITRIVAARSIVEIGCEWGVNTVRLIDWALAATDRRLHLIDPAPSQELRDRVTGLKNDTRVRLIESLSLTALPKLAPADIYLIDGDHNYHTVLNELRLVAASCGDQPPVIVLHDVGWPCARRDTYYAPDGLPHDAVHPHTWSRGVVTGVAGTVEGGFRSEGKFAFAEHEGAPRCGVLTAVEDFRTAAPGWSYFSIDAIFGVGVLMPDVHPGRRAVFDFLTHPAYAELTALLERNRLQLYLKVLELQDENARLHESLRKTNEELQTSASVRGFLRKKIRHLFDHCAMKRGASPERMSVRHR